MLTIGADLMRLWKRLPCLDRGVLFFHLFKLHDCLDVLGIALRGSISQELRLEDLLAVEFDVREDLLEAFLILSLF